MAGAESARPRRRGRLAVYTDYTYRRGTDGIYADRAFALFLGRLAAEFDELIIAGKIDPAPGGGRYRLPATVRFVELPYYADTTRVGEAGGAMAGSLGTFWRLLSDVDLVWLLGPHPLAITFALLARLRRVPVRLGVRQDFRAYVRARHPGRRWVHLAGDLLEWIWRRLARTARVIAVGPTLAAAYPRDRTLEISVSLVRDQEICDAAAVAGRSYDNGELRALSVGRLEAEKNPLLLADVIARLVSLDDRWRLIVCGEGPLDTALRERLAALGVSDHVELLGYVPHDRGLQDLYRSSHVLLHISWTEGLPQVMFEAFAARLPVAATAVGGVRSLADAVLMFPPGDAAAAVHAVDRIRAEAALRRSLTESGVELVSSRTLDAEARRVASFLVG
jgi:glycosyltransferase involved in cell wall biosynthesis